MHRIYVFLVLTHLIQNNMRIKENIGIDTNIEVIIVSLITWQAHHSPRAFYETKSMMNKQILSI